MKSLRVILWFLIGVAFLIFFPADVFATNQSCGDLFEEESPAFASESWISELQQKHLPELQVQAHEIPLTHFKHQDILDTELAAINPHWQVNSVEIYSPESAHVFRRMFKQLSSLSAMVKQRRLDVGRVKSSQIREQFHKSLSKIQDEIGLLKREIQMVRDNGYPQEESLDLALRWMSFVKSLGETERDYLHFSSESYEQNYQIYKQHLFQSGVFHTSVQFEDRKIEPRIILSNHRVLDLEKIKYRSSGAFFLFIPHLGRPLLDQESFFQQWDQITRQFSKDREEFQSTFIGRNFTNRQQRYHQLLQSITQVLLQNQQDQAAQLFQDYLKKVLLEQGRGFGYLKRNFHRRMFFDAMQPEIIRRGLTTEVVYRSFLLGSALIKPSVFEYLR